MIPQRVLDAFGLRGEAQPLEGGQGVAFLVGDAVVKQVGHAGSRAQATRDDAEEEWRAALYERIMQDGFRVPRPLRTGDGLVIVDGWVAYEFLEGEHSLERWDDVLATCDSFHAALRDEPRPGFLDRADDPWTTAQRAVWGETSLEPFLACATSHRWSTCCVLSTRPRSSSTPTSPSTSSSPRGCRLP